MKLIFHLMAFYESLSGLKNGVENFRCVKKRFI